MPRKFEHSGVREGGKNTGGLSSAASVGRQAWTQRDGRVCVAMTGVTSNGFQ